MSTNPLLALGPHQFEIMPLNFQELERETEVLWPSIPRFGRAPTFQMTGEGENPLTISGLLFPDDFGGREEFEALRATQMAKRPVTLGGWATGRRVKIWGRVGIRKIKDTQQIINSLGQGTKIKFSIVVVPLPRMGNGGFW